MNFEATPDVAAVWAEMARRAEVASSASPAGEGLEGRLTHCSGVDGGLVGLSDGTEANGAPV